ITRAGKYIFRIYPSDTLEGSYMAQLASEELQLRRILVLAIDNDFGRGLAAVFRKAFRGEPPPQVGSHPAHGADFAALADKVRGFKPDGIYLAGYYSDMAQALRQLHSLPGSPRILSTSSFGNPKTLESAGQAAEGVIFPAIVFDPESDDPSV